MRLTNIAGLKNVGDYVAWKLGIFGREEKTFRNLFKYMFSEENNIISEVSDGYRF